MSVVMALLGLAFLVVAAYRGFSVILFAPIAAMIPLLWMDPHIIPTVFTGLYMTKVGSFVQIYFPIFLLGAVFGKLIEISGFAQSIVLAVIRLVGPQRAMLAVVIVGGLLTYGGVSVFIAVFAIYPFAAMLFRRADIPKRLIPATLAVGFFGVTQDVLPGTAQLQNIIPTAFFHTTAWAAPGLGIVGAIIIFSAGFAYIEGCRRAAAKAGEGYGDGHINEPLLLEETGIPNPLLAISPLLAVGVFNLVFTLFIPRLFGTSQSIVLPGLKDPIVTAIGAVTAIWALEGALAIGILLIVLLGFTRVKRHFVEGIKPAINGALLAILNCGSEFGFGAVIAALPGFLVVQRGLEAIPNPLVNAALTTTTLAAITGSATGGLSIALAAMADKFIAAAHAAHIPLEVLHRIISMACGGLDDMPHNSAVITMLLVTGLTHRQGYKGIFVLTLIKTVSVFAVIGIYYATGLV